MPHAYHWVMRLEERGGCSEEEQVNGLRQFVGRTALVSTMDGGAIRGTLWRALRSGLEIRDASDPVHGREIAGSLWIPTHSIAQVQVVGGDS